MTFDIRQRIDLQKAANDSGFEIVAHDADNECARLSSADTDLVVEARDQAGAYLLSLRNAAVARALSAEPRFERAADDFLAHGVGGLTAVLLRAWQVSRALPLSPLRRYEAAVERVLAADVAEDFRTEAEALVKIRIGQDCFRNALMAWWQGRCAVTGLAQAEMLRASHMKPWKDCASDTERLDVFNGLLLTADWDAAFDKGLVTFDDGGGAIFSRALETAARARLGDGCIRPDRPLTDQHLGYLTWHRTEVFDRLRAD